MYLLSTLTPMSSRPVVMCENSPGSAKSPRFSSTSTLTPLIEFVMSINLRLNSLTNLIPASIEFRMYEISSMKSWISPILLGSVVT